MKVASLFSGGKDSTFAIYVAIQQGWEVMCLVSVFSKNPDSYMFHAQNIHLVPMLSKALRIPFVAVRTEGEKEKELDDLKITLEKLTPERLDGIITGAIASDYQWSRVNRICHDVGLRTFSPLWRKRQGMLLEDMLFAGFQTIVVKVSAAGLGRELLGKILDRDTFSYLCRQSEISGINIAGEGGEFETLVLDCPIFDQRLMIDDAETVWERDCGYLNVKEAHLERKADRKTKSI